MIKQFFYQYKLILFGAIIFSLYFWNRFLHVKTSKILPLNLSVLGFMLLLYLCLIYIYIIIALLYPRKANDILENIINWLFKPLSDFDKFLKSFSIIKK